MNGSPGRKAGDRTGLRERIWSQDQRFSDQGQSLMGVFKYMGGPFPQRWHPNKALYRGPHAVQQEALPNFVLRAEWSSRTCFRKIPPKRTVPEVGQTRARQGRRGPVPQHHHPEAGLWKPGQWRGIVETSARLEANTGREPGRARWQPTTPLMFPWPEPQGMTQVSQKKYFIGDGRPKSRGEAPE